MGDNTQQYYKSLGAPSKGFYFSEVTKDKVLEILSTLNSSKDTGLDHLSPRFMKN